MKGIVRGRQHLALVDVVDPQLLQDLAFDKVPDARFGHDGDGDGLHDLLDELRVGHAGDAALGADVGGDALEGHDGAGAGFFGDARLVCVDDVHDHAPFEHLGEAVFDGEVLAGALGVGVGGGSVVLRGG